MNKLSIIIPGLDEAENLPACISEIIDELIKNKILHEVLVIDDGSTDNTHEVVASMIKRYPSIRYVRNEERNGFGRAIRLGLDEYTGDAVAIMMADRSDSPKDLVSYWKTLQEGYECVFGSRFIRGSKVSNYPFLKCLISKPNSKQKSQTLRPLPQD